MHFICCGSGFHSPFLIQVDELVPLSTRPEGQVKFAVVPSIGRSLYTTLGSELFVADSRKYPQLAVIGIHLMFVIPK